MTTAFVLGNGVSRQTVSLYDLQKFGPIYACNAIYKEFTPTVLVATDKPIATQIQQSGYPIKNRFYTRRPIPGLGAKELTKQYFGYSSGPNAVGVSAQDGNQRIFLVGFDMGPLANNKFNNVYADTEFYKPSTAIPTYTGNWIKQLQHIITDFPATTFVRVIGPTTADISELNALKNYQTVDLGTFIDRINKQEDL